MKLQRDPDQSAHCPYANHLQSLNAQLPLCWFLCALYQTDPILLGRNGWNLKGFSLWNSNPNKEKINVLCPVPRIPVTTRMKQKTTFWGSGISNPKRPENVRFCRGTRGQLKQPQLEPQCFSSTLAGLVQGVTQKSRRVRSHGMENLSNTIYIYIIDLS